MGGKRTRKRKLLYLCIASLICFGFLGCAVLQEKKKVEVKEEEIRKEEEFKKEEVRTDGAPKEEVQKKEDSLTIFSGPLLRAKKFLEQQDYDGSLKENQKVLSLSGKNPPGDEALFNIGLIYAHPNNPKKDYGRSHGFFKRLMKDYPQSPLVEQAKIWVGILQENEKLTKTVEKLYQVMEGSKKVDIEIEEKKREKGK